MVLSSVCTDIKEIYMILPLHWVVNSSTIVDCQPGFREMRQRRAVSQKLGKKVSKADQRSAPTVQQARPRHWPLADELVLLIDYVLLMAMAYY